MSDGPELVTLDRVAELLGVNIKRVHQLLGDGELVAIRDAEGHRCVAADFLDPTTENGLVKALPQVIRLLRDVHYQDDEIVDWLFRPDDSLPGTPIQALRENRGREVKRRAQVAGF